MSAQKEFEKDVKKLKTAAEKENLLQFSKHWNYGKDPHKGGKTGSRKALPRACSKLIRQHLSEWIPADCRLQFCTLNGGTACCAQYAEHCFGEPLNLVSLVQQRYGLTLLPKENQSKITKATINHIIPEIALKTKLQIVINDVHVNQFYVKRVKQDRLAKSMDISQNDYRMSYAPRILVESTGTAGQIAIAFACRDACIGVGFCDLVKWKNRATIQASSNSAVDYNISDPTKAADLHSVIHICDSFELVRNVSISFGVLNVVNAIKINNIRIKLIDDDGPIILYQYDQQNRDEIERKQPVETEASSVYMPTIGDINALYSNAAGHPQTVSLSTAATLNTAYARLPNASTNANANANATSLGITSHELCSWPNRSSSPISNASTSSSSTLVSMENSASPAVKKRRLSRF